MAKVGPNEPDKNARFQEEFAKLATRWDADGNGTFSMDECKVMIRELTSQKGRIVYDMKNKVDSQMAKFDSDGNGSFDYHEVYNIIDDLLEGQERQSVLKKFIGLLFVIVLALLGALLGISMLANEATKEAHVSGAAMISLTGEAVQVDAVESNADLFDLPGVSTESLAKMKDLVFYVDLSANADVGGWAEATYKVGGVYKPSNDVAMFTMTSGERLILRRPQKSGEIRIDGITYPIADKCSGTCSIGARRLLTEVEAKAVTFTGPRPRDGGRMQQSRRQLGFFSALMTSGSFTMMQAGSF